MGLVSGACSVDGRKSCLWLVRGEGQMRGRVDLLIKSANRPQRPSMLRSALSNQEKSVDNLLFSGACEGRGRAQKNRNYQDRKSVV